MRQASTNASDTQFSVSLVMCYRGWIGQSSDRSEWLANTSHKSYTSGSSRWHVGSGVSHLHKQFGPRNASPPSAAARLQSTVKRRHQFPPGFPLFTRSGPRKTTHHARRRWHSVPRPPSEKLPSGKEKFPWCEQRQRCKRFARVKSWRARSGTAQHQKVHSKSRQIDEFMKEREMWKAGRKQWGCLFPFPRRSRQFRQRARIGRSMSERN